MSVLDARIRRIAREEAAAGGVTFEDGPDPMAELREQIAALTARVDELEKASAAPAAKRAARKATSEPSEKTAESTA